MHGDDDQIVPYKIRTVIGQAAEGRNVKTYKGFPHGMPTTNAETIDAELLAFIKA